MKKNKITLEFNSILKDVIRNIWVVILSALIGSMGFYVFTHSTYEPVYTSKATIAILRSGVSSGSYSLLNASSEKASLLERILSESTVKEAAAEHLGIESFDGTVQASVVSQTNFIEVKVTSDHPEKSYKLLSAVLESHHKVSGKVLRGTNISVITMPTVPSAPSNRISNENRNLIVIACITLSLATILAFSIMRDTIKKESDFNDKIDSRLIGTIAHENKNLTLQEIRQKKKKGLLIHSNAYISLRFTESFHKIAAKLEHIKNHESSKIFAITSVAENEGKSTCAANIAVSLADRGNEVLLIDFDLKKPALFKIFDEEYDEKSEFSALMKKEIPFEDFALKRFKKTSLSLAINTNPEPDYQSWIADGTFSEMIEKFKKDFDFIIIDTAPISLDASVTDVIQKVDKTILIVRTDTVKAEVINEFISTISKISANLAGCILNDVYLNILPFSFTGNDESNYYGRYPHSKYSYYRNYAKHSSKKDGVAETTVSENN